MDLTICKLEIIDRGFPELAGVQIETKYKKMPDAYLELTSNSRRSYLIRVDNSLRGARRNILIGGMSHEIAHISRDIRMGPITRFFDQIFYDNWRWYQNLDERNTDLLVIRRGLGPELLEFLRYADKRREEYTLEDGLSVKEVEELLRQGVS